jgi:branched-chain amino acid transport system ATP-binding protein
MTSEFILETRDLCRLFGALAAVNHVNLKFHRHQVHAIIGPNGAGKTTLINLLSGDINATSGSILLNDQDITRLPPNKISQLGVGRSYQKTNIFLDSSCLQNCWLASQSRLSSCMRFIRPARLYDKVRDRAEKALRDCGLFDRRHTVAAQMSYGEQRQLEIGMMLATDPQLLLLDEPLAGMGPDESAQIIDLLKKLAESHTLILIEHDMDAVFSIAQELTVMVNGKILETGSVEQIRNSKAVHDAYLGGDESEA